MNLRPAIIIPCWDRYEFLWPFWNHYFQKYWAHSLEWPVYFMTEEKKVDFPNTINIQVGKCDSMTRVRRCFEAVDHETIFLIQEDMCPKEKVSGDLFNNLYNKFVAMKMNSMRVQHPCPHTTYNSHTGLIDTDSDYLFSFQPGFFNKDFFMDVTEDAKDLWDMEIYGTDALRQDKYKDTVYIHIYSWYEELIRQGRWRSGPLAQAAKKGIKL